MILIIGNEALQVRMDKKGFTLIEVMVSIIVLSIGLVAVIQTFSSVLHALKIARNNMQATLLVEDKMEELAEANRVNKGTAEGTRSGIFKENKKYSWSASVTTESGEGLKKLDLNINWEDGRRSGKLLVSTYLTSLVGTYQEGK